MPAIPSSSFSTTGSPWPASWEPSAQPAEPPQPAEPEWAPPEAAQLLAPASGPFGYGAPAALPLQPIQPLQPMGSAQVAAWLDEQERQVTHPRLVEDGLRRAGWYPPQAAMEAMRYRRRFNEHTLGYSALLISTGMAALAAGTAGHVLASGIDHGINRNALGFWLTALVVAVPFAIWAHLWAARVDREDPVAVWSQSRRTLAQFLLWGCGIVGIARLMIYGAQLIGSLVGSSFASGDSAAAGAINVAITVVIALPLGLWAFHFLHRFDDEDPARPRPQQRRSSR